MGVAGGPGLPGGLRGSAATGTGNSYGSNHPFAGPAAPHYRQRRWRSGALNQGPAAGSLPGPAISGRGGLPGRLLLHLCGQHRPRARHRKEGPASGHPESLVSGHEGAAGNRPDDPSLPGSRQDSRNGDLRLHPDERHPRRLGAPPHLSPENGPARPVAGRQSGPRPRRRHARLLVGTRLCQGRGPQPFPGFHSHLLPPIRLRRSRTGLLSPPPVLQAGRRAAASGHHDRVCAKGPRHPARDRPGTGQALSAGHTRPRHSRNGPQNRSGRGAVDEGRPAGSADRGRRLHALRRPVADIRRPGPPVPYPGLSLHQPLPRTGGHAQPWPPTSGPWEPTGSTCSTTSGSIPAWKGGAWSRK